MSVSYILDITSIHVSVFMLYPVSVSVSVRYGVNPIFKSESVPKIVMIGQLRC